MDQWSQWIADGCRCNSPRGINHGLVPVDVCTCVECDPEQTGASRAGVTKMRSRIAALEAEVAALKAKAVEVIDELVSLMGVHYDCDDLHLYKTEERARIAALVDEARVLVKS